MNWFRKAQIDGRKKVKPVVWRFRQKALRTQREKRVQMFGRLRPVSKLWLIDFQQCVCLCVGGQA